MIISVWHCPITWHTALPHSFYQRYISAKASLENQASSSGIFTGLWTFWCAVSYTAAPSTAFTPNAADPVLSGSSVQIQTSNTDTSLLGDQPRVDHQLFTEIPYF